MSDKAEAEMKPIKRGRGRPPKAKPENEAPVQPANPKDIKGRGRPPKGRGRPPKTEEEDMTQAPKTNVREEEQMEAGDKETPKRRGRPPKAKVPDYQDEASDEDAMDTDKNAGGKITEANGGDKSQGSGGNVGIVDESELPDDEDQPKAVVKKKRGRPSKAAAARE